VSHEQPTVHPAYEQVTAVEEPQPAVEERYEDDDWQEPEEELPRRPRRRLLTPVPLTLLAVLLTACGFIGGVLVEKSQSSGTSTSAATAGLAARLAALRGAGATGAPSGSSGAGSAGSAAGPGGAGASVFGGSSAGRVTGQVDYLSGDTLYVTNAEGNTVKVTTSPGTAVTKTVTASVHGIHPGETVTVTGSPGSNGTVGAESIRVGGGGLASLFGGASGGSSAGSGTSGSGASSVPNLFGNGG